MIWGDTGTGKTRLALHFPKPVVIDMERGTDHYAEEFEFERICTTSADEAEEALDWLLTNTHEYRTLVIDPITILWDSLQRKYSDQALAKSREKGKGKYDFADLTFREWGTIKAHLKAILRKVLAVDMNVVVTARQKLVYSENGATKDPIATFDGEKSLPYLFDTILHLYRDREGKSFMGRTVKDRTGKLPEDLGVLDYSMLEQAWGTKLLRRKATLAVPATGEQVAELVELSRQAGMDEAALVERLESYGASCVSELTAQNAATIIQKLKAYIERKNGK